MTVKSSWPSEASSGVGVAALVAPAAGAAVVAAGATDAEIVSEVAAGVAGAGGAPHDVATAAAKTSGSAITDRWRRMRANVAQTVPFRPHVSVRGVDDAYRALFEQGPTPSWVFDEVTFEILAVNDEMTATYGYTREELLAMNARELRPPDETSRFVAYVAAFRASGARVNAPIGRWYHKRKSGEVFEVEIVATRVTFRDRAAVLASVREITSTAPRDPVRLEASERRFRALVEHGNDAVVLIDEHERFVYASPSLERVLGYAPDELVGKSTRDFLHPDDATASLTAHRSPPGTSVEVTSRVRHKDGSWRWLEGTTSNLLDEPAVRAIVSNRHDVTEKREAEERLRFQAALLARVNEAVIASDATARITYWNEAAERLYGYAASEAIGRNGTELLRPEWRPGDLVAHADALRATGHWRGEVTHVTKAGERIVVETSISLLRDDKGRPIGGINVMQDATARRRLEEQLRQSQKMEAIGVFAGGVAHDFNNLLGVILGFADLVARRLSPEHPEAGSLAEIVAAALRGAELTRKMLAFSRRQIMRKTTLDMGVAIDGLTKLLERIMGEDVELVVEKAAVALPVHADAVQIEQVLLNLCTNARQAMPQGGRLAISLRESILDAAFVERNPWARTGRFAELVVTDTGIGMDASTRDRVFDPFFTTREHGTGLGLATAYGIVQQHDGLIHVESEPGRGATFRMFLPLLDPATAVPAIPRPVHPITPRENETILVAEDAAPLRAFVATTLTSLGYRVIEVGDGEAAVREYERRAPEIALAVLDVVMPKLGALDAYTLIRAIRPDARVLFTTGYAPEATQLAAQLEDARVRLLPKPFTSHALGMAVREALDA